MKKKIKITDRRKKRAGCRTVMVYKTNLGDMTTKKLAAYIGVNQNTVAQWIRDAKGDVTDERFQARIAGKDEVSTIGKANWEGLGAKARTSKLNSIPDPGTFEKE